MELYQDRPELDIKGKKGEEKKDEPSNLLVGKKDWALIVQDHELKILQFIIQFNCTNLSINKDSKLE